MWPIRAPYFWKFLRFQVVYTRPLLSMYIVPLLDLTLSICPSAHKSECAKERPVEQGVQLGLRCRATRRNLDIYLILKS